MVQAYADNRYVLETTHKKPSVVSSRVRRLLKYGFIKEEKKLRTTPSMSDFWLVRPTPRGIRYLKKYNATEVLRALVRVDRIECATLWMYSYVSDLGELPEFITHLDPKVRTAARTRFDILARKRKQTPN